MSCPMAFKPTTAFISPRKRVLLHRMRRVSPSRVRISFSKWVGIVPAWALSPKEDFAQTLAVALGDECIEPVAADEVRLVPAGQLRQKLVAEGNLALEVELDGNELNGFEDIAETAFADARFLFEAALFGDVANQYLDAFFAGARIMYEHGILHDPFVVSGGGTEVSEPSRDLSASAHVFAQRTGGVHFGRYLAHALADGLCGIRETVIGLEHLQRALVHVEHFSLEGVAVQTDAGQGHCLFAQPLEFRRAAPTAFQTEHRISCSLPAHIAPAGRRSSCRLGNSKAPPRSRGLP